MERKTHALPGPQRAPAELGAEEAVPIQTKSAIVTKNESAE
jgi:hypothetical protein